jgi:hypothetical protein
VVPEYTPMAPTLIREPFHRDGWIYEEKVDGWRMLAYKNRNRVRLLSRNGRDHTRRFADLAAAIAKLSARTLVLDEGWPSTTSSSAPAWLREPGPDAVASPPLLIAFDVMFRDRRDLAGLPLSARGIHLEDVIDGANLVLPVRRLARNGLDAWAQVEGNGYEGLVAKDEASMYESRLTRPWLKVAQKGWTNLEDRWHRPLFEPRGERGAVAELLCHAGIVRCRADRAAVRRGRAHRQHTATGEYLNHQRLRYAYRGTPRRCPRHLGDHERPVAVAHSGGRCAGDQRCRRIRLRCDRQSAVFGSRLGTNPTGKTGSGMRSCRAGSTRHVHSRACSSWRRAASRYSSLPVRRSAYCSSAFGTHGTRSRTSSRAGVPTAASEVRSGAESLTLDRRAD